MAIEILNDQRILWDRQHSTRGVDLECKSLRYTPNDTAVTFAQHLLPNSKILEVGSANGRDARYWATLGHTIIASDFSLIALKQLTEIGLEQCVMGSVTPVVWDVCVGRLPVDTKDSIDAFYARSALHINDKTMMEIAKHLNKILISGGSILIEGKSTNDKKIIRSHKPGNGIAIDHEEDGHVRRIWTFEFVQSMCDKFNWNIVYLNEVREEEIHSSAKFMRLIAKKT